MPDKIRVACVQMTSRADKSANLEKADRLVAQAAATGDDVVVLPEKWNAIGDAAVYHATAEPIEGGESVSAMSEWARAHGITIVGGSIAEFREGREKLSNTSLVFDPEGRIVATYRKIHLFDVEVGGVVYRESEAEEPGDEPVVADVEDWRIGLSICYDVRFPELYRILTLEGAQLVTVPAHFTTPTGKDHWHVLLRAGAIENQLYVVADCVEEWGLRLGEPYPQGAAGHAVRAELPDGAPAVLKLIFPDRESEHEADTLALWNGDGAVRLLARDDERSALVIERCAPGTALSAAGPDVALEVLIGLLPRLWVEAAEPFHTLEDEASWWIGYLPEQWERSGRSVERRLVDAAVDALSSLSRSQGEQVLLHQDLHGDNVLAAEREPWLVIDPKPLLGEREFSVAPIVRSFELGHSRRDALD